MLIALALLATTSQAKVMLISLIFSAQQIQAGKKSRPFGSLAISVKIKLAYTFQSKSWPNLAIKFLLLSYKVQTYM